MATSWHIVRPENYNELTYVFTYVTLWTSQNYVICMNYQIFTSCVMKNNHWQNKRWNFLETYISHILSIYLILFHVHEFFANMYIYVLYVWKPYGGNIYTSTRDADSS